MTSERRPEQKTPWLTIIGVVATVIGAAATIVFGVIPLLRRDDDPPPPQPTSQALQTGPAVPDPASTNADEHVVIRSGPLTLSEGMGADLDVALTEVQWARGVDMGYSSCHPDHDCAPAIVSHDFLRQSASLPAGSTGTWSECADATYGDVAWGPAVAPGRMVCIRTTEDRLALIVVTDVVVWTQQTPIPQLSADVTVWS